MQIRLTERTDPEILKELGRRLARIRKTSGLTQMQAAQAAELDRTTVSRAERGDNLSLLNLVRLLRVYGRLEALEAFLPEPEVSPMRLVREHLSRG